ncbi:coiled-coil domain-containing protein 194 isoform X1 [Struthio camelus]|uniref:coiled-coil domain-containing protein 194 isoform X1 n=1 Tax=Struthio camelus TaxID=8801 RepID=UPI003603C073
MLRPARATRLARRAELPPTCSLSRAATCEKPQPKAASGEENPHVAIRATQGATCAGAAGTSRAAAAGAGEHPRAPSPPPPAPSMDPGVPKATLKVLGLCAALLLLVAAVTVAVAVMVWRSEALRKLQGCRERAANESRELGDRVAQLEQERGRLRRAAAQGARREEALQLLLAQARGDGEKLNASLASCREHAAALGSDAAALRSEVLALRREGAELAGSNAALRGRVEAPRSRRPVGGSATGLRRRLGTSTLGTAAAARARPPPAAPFGRARRLPGTAAPAGAAQLTRRSCCGAGAEAFLHQRGSLLAKGCSRLPAAPLRRCCLPARPYFFILRFLPVSSPQCFQ